LQKSITEAKIKLQNFITISQISSIYVPKKSIQNKISNSKLEKIISISQISSISVPKTNFKIKIQ
jgi:hypothetical protein